LISAIPDVFPAISDTTTLPGTAVVLWDVTVIFSKLFEKRPIPGVVVNVTGIFDKLIRLPDVSKSSAVMVEELAPSAGSEVGLADSVIEATFPDVPIVTFVVCVTPPDSHLISAIPGVVPAINETTTSPELKKEFAVITVMVFDPLGK
jgi:hypothetical protein